MMKKGIINYLNKLPYIRGIYKDLNDIKSFHRFGPGHYHDPIPNLNEVEKHFNTNYSAIQDIKFDFNNQMDELNSLLTYYKEMPFNFYDDSKNINLRYKNLDSYYRFSDAVFLFLYLRKYKPKNIIEVGSGFSTAIMLDTNDLFFNENKINFTFIEPNPQDRLDGLLRLEDRKHCKIFVNKVQDVDLSIYESLKKDDILFIDSSHISKTGSDLNFILFNILPRLNEGVIIHFHDVFYPFEYPKDWILKERFYWNECYLLRAFLMNNSNYSILFFNSAAHKYHKEYLTKEMPETMIDHEHCGAIWIQKNFK